ncbi:porin [Noviherbaspirillum aridicola]|uniref:Porin n=1 Tax=Noviherbaspirillum aridicola TaxID=2849687 RepID=A0ABQ4Q3F0_9BURK|nr:porin [Noviherbaspirillum aridicola]GIZ51713.1 porin [Noviherbaspirillum aridicola]
MKKTLLAAAAVAALSAAGAQAQTNVTIYGIVDAGISRIDNGDETTYGLQSGGQSGSRIGFRGTEDLGGGMKAIFVLENGFTVDNGRMTQNADGDDVLFGRQAFVGLSGGFGELKLGRQYNPIRVAVESVDPFGLGLAGNASRFFNVYGERADNTINYTSPNFGGLSGQVAYSFGEIAGDTSASRQVGLSIGYAAGPLNVVLAHHNQDLSDTADVDAGDSKSTMLGATFDFRVAKLHAAWERTKADDGAVDTVDRDDMMIGVSAPVGAAGTVLASYTRRSDDIGADRDADQFAIGYIHALSKRTNLYTSYARVSNDDRARVGGAARNGENPSVFNVGIRHRF